ncbi:MAG: ABC transporter substrate-binding protein [Gammaproteobacteria bacterium]
MHISGSIRQYLIKTILSSMLLLAFQQAVAADTAISAPVDKLHSVLLENMKQEGEQDFAGRYDSLEPVVAANFDTPLISKVILGRYWRELDEQTQQDFINLFRELTVATYANRFDSYGGHHFNTVAVEDLRKERHLVKTELQAAGEKPVSLDYIVQNSEDGWKIISVIANGVNDLSLKRAEYGTVIKDKGFDSLVEDIRKQIDSLKPG